MTALKLSACPICGGTARLDWGSVAEYYGHAWQNVGIACNQDAGDAHCDQSISMNVDSDRMANGQGHAVEAAVIQAWNQVALVLRR